MVLAFIDDLEPRKQALHSEWQRAGECLHLLSVISPIADDLAVVFLPLLPAGLHELLAERGVALVPVPEEEYLTLGCGTPSAARSPSSRSSSPTPPAGGRSHSPACRSRRPPSPMAPTVRRWRRLRPTASDLTGPARSRRQSFAT